MGRDQVCQGLSAGPPKSPSDARKYTKTSPFAQTDQSCKLLQQWDFNWTYRQRSSIGTNADNQGGAGRSLDRPPVVRL